MAKTKAVASSAAAATAPSAVPAEDPVAREESQEVDKLKTLNQILLKETKERREKVSDLQSRLDLLAIDNAISDDLERGVTRIVFASRLAVLAEMKAAAEARVRSGEADLVLVRSQVGSLVGEKDAATKALDAAILERYAARRDLDEAKQQAEAREAAARKEIDGLVFDLEQREETIRSLEADKGGMEETISSIEESLSNTTDKLQSITGEKVEMEKDLERANREWEACKRDLDTVTAELQMSTKKMNSSLAECAALKVGIAKMQQEINEEKSKFAGDMDVMMETVHTIQCKKEDLEEEKNVLEAKISILQETVTKLEAIVQEKENMEEELRAAARALSVANQSLESVTEEKDDAKRALDQATLERELSQRKLAEEEEWKAVASKEIERLKVEYNSFEKSKIRLQNDNEKQKIDYACELDGLRVSLGKTTEEKDSLCKLTDKQYFEITYLQGQVEYLLSTAVRLNAEKEDTKKLKVRIEELEKNKNDAHKELQKIKASLDKLVAENKSINLDCDAMAVERISLEEKVGNIPRVVEEVEEKTIVIDKNSGEILSLSRSTSDPEAAINAVGQGHEDGVEQEIVVVEEEPDEIVKDITGKLKVMKTVLKSSVQMIKAREEKLKVLRGAIEEASKKSGAWCWVFPTATALLAAITWASAVKR